MNPVWLTSIETPIGSMTACATDEGVCLLEFNDRKDLGRQKKLVQEKLGRPLIPGSNEYLLRLEVQLQEYFAGQRTTFDLPLVMTGTDFQEKVWEGLLKIPYGQTVTYLSLSRRLGNPRAIRAVSAANGANRMALLVPCHRVIGSDGKLVGYAGGIWRKQWLLEHESGQSKMKLFH